MRLIHGLKLILGDSWWMTHSWFSNRLHNNGALSKLRIHSTLEDSDPTERSDTFSWNLKWNWCFPKSDLVSVFNKPTTFQSNLATLTWSPHDSLRWSLPVKSQFSVSRHFWLKSLTYKTVSLETSLVPKTSAAAACARWQLGAPHGSLVGPWLCFPHQLPALRLPATHRPHHCMALRARFSTFGMSWQSQKSESFTSPCICPSFG